MRSDAKRVFRHRMRENVSMLRMRSLSNSGGALAAEVSCENGLTTNQTLSRWYRISEAEGAVDAEDTADLLKIARLLGSPESATAERP